MIIVDGKSLTLESVMAVARNHEKIQLSEEAVSNIKRSRNYVDSFIKENKKLYGITTGFGKFSDIKISSSEAKLLQKNLILSHSVGVGEYLNEEQTRAVMLLRINALSKGHSGIRPETIERLVFLLNENILPLIPEKGSLGASGDLAPLSHMVHPIIGFGKCKYNDEIVDIIDVLKKYNLEAIELEEKEGLALINGTQVMTAIGLITCYDALKLIDAINVVSSITLEALSGVIDAFDSRIHTIRNHAGQVKIAADMHGILSESKLSTRQGEVRMQDAYSLRCIPQVHGASLDALNYVKDKILIEINSVTDNPIVFSDNAISGGNFHGQPMALSFDFMSIAISELANISERRIERLVNPALSNLPAFLIKEGGLNSGFMIAQYSAASLVSENKVLSHPSSVDSIPSSANQEDHVSMGTIGARKASEILFNTRNVIAIELLCACQAIDIIDGYNKMAGKTKALYDKLRENVDYMQKDKFIQEDMLKAYEVIVNHE